MWLMPHLYLTEFVVQTVIRWRCVYFAGLIFSFSSVCTVGVDGFRQWVIQRWYLMNPFVFIINCFVLTTDCFSFICVEFECVLSQLLWFGCRQIIVEYCLIVNCVGVTTVSGCIVVYVFNGVMWYEWAEPHSMYTLRSEGTYSSDDIVRLCQDLNNFVGPFPFEGVKRDFSDCVLILGFSKKTKSFTFNGDARAFRS